MPGIWGCISKKKDINIDLTGSFHKEEGIFYLIDKYHFNNAYFGRHSVNKFQCDKDFTVIDNSLVSNDGIIFNLRDMLAENQSKQLSHLLLSLYRKEHTSLVNNLRGNFAGFVYDSIEDELVVFTDHFASKPVYYFYDSQSCTLIFASELKVVVKGMKELGFESSLDIIGSYCLLTLGYMLNDFTLVKEIKKLPPGNTLLYKNGSIEIKKYYNLLSTPYIEGPEEEIISELDKRFKKAIQFEYEKDLEYGYFHIATLSGGLDSRTNVAYAKEQNYNDITCFTFSENDYLDDKISKKICSNEHFEFIFYSLDNGDYLMKNIDRIISSNDGLVFYLGAAHLYNCLKKLSLGEYGIVHTGLIGDLVLGSYLKSKSHKQVDNKTIDKISYSSKLLDKLSKHIDFNDIKYENDEMFSFYERCINGVFNGYRMIEQFTEFSSPFLYVEFVEYAMRIHPKYRYNEKIYLKWISEYTPKFSEYKWEKYNLPPKYPLIVLESSRILKIPQKIIRKKMYGKKARSMNPTEYWWSTNEKLQSKVIEIFSENLACLESHPDLLNDTVHMFKEGSLIERTQVLTLLLAIKMLNIGDK